MNLVGLNINNSYLVRKKIVQGEFLSYWLCHSIFSTNKFALKLIGKKYFLNSNDIMIFKESLIKSEKIDSDMIIDFLEVDEFEDFVFISAEVPDGENLVTYSRRERRIKNADYQKPFLELLDLYSYLYETGYPVKHLSLADFWKSGGGIKLINFRNNLTGIHINELVYDKMEKLVSGKNEFARLGILYYMILTYDLKLGKTDIFLRDNNPALHGTGGVHKITSKLLLGLYDDINGIRKDLGNLKDEKKTETAGRMNAAIAEKHDLFEERRLYFEKLEKERVERMQKSVAEKKIDPAMEDKVLKEYNKRLFEQRRYYFENNERERWNYLRTSEMVSNNHIDNLAEQSRAYFESRMNHRISSEITGPEGLGNNEEIPEFIRKISNLSRDHVSSLKQIIIEYLNKIKESMDIKKDPGYFKIMKSDALRYLKGLIGESNKYFSNVSNEAKKDFILEMEQQKLKSSDIDANPEATMKMNEELNKIEKIINETVKYYKKIVPEVDKSFSDKIDNNIVKKIELKEDMNENRIQSMNESGIVKEGESGNKLPKTKDDSVLIEPDDRGYSEDQGKQNKNTLSGKKNMKSDKKENEKKEKIINGSNNSNKEDLKNLQDADKTPDNMSDEEISKQAAYNSEKEKQIEINMKESENINEDINENMKSMDFGLHGKTMKKNNSNDFVNGDNIGKQNNIKKIDENNSVYKQKNSNDNIINNDKNLTDRERSKLEESFDLNYDSIKEGERTDEKRENLFWRIIQRLIKLYKMMIASIGKE